MTGETPSSTCDSHLKASDTPRAAPVPLEGLLPALDEPPGTASENPRGSRRDGNSDGLPQHGQHAATPIPMAEPGDCMDDSRYCSCVRAQKGLRASQGAKRLLENPSRDEVEGVCGRREDVAGVPRVREQQAATGPTRTKRSTKHPRSEGVEAPRLSDEMTPEYSRDGIGSPCSSEPRMPSSRQRSSEVQTSSMHISTRRQLDPRTNTGALEDSAALSAARVNALAHRGEQQSASLIDRTPAGSLGSSSTPSKGGNATLPVPSLASREGGPEATGFPCQQDERGEMRSAYRKQTRRSPSQPQPQVDEDPASRGSRASVEKELSDEPQPTQPSVREEQVYAQKAEECLNSLMRTMFQPFSRMLHSWGKGCVTAQLRDYKQRQRAAPGVARPPDRSRLYEDREAEGPTAAGRVRTESHEKGGEEPESAEINAIHKDTADTSGGLPDWPGGQPMNPLHSGTGEEASRSCTHIREDGKTAGGEVSLRIRELSRNCGNCEGRSLENEAGGGSSGLRSRCPGAPRLGLPRKSHV